MGTGSYRPLAYCGWGTIHFRIFLVQWVAQTGRKTSERLILGVKIIFARIGILRRRSHLWVATPEIAGPSHTPAPFSTGARIFGRPLKMSGRNLAVRQPLS